MFILQLYKRYGNRDLEVTVKSRNAPMVKVVPKSVDFMFMGSAAVSVIQENGTRTSVFTLGMVNKSGYKCMYHIHMH